jgi:hypothetical protein
MSLSDIFESIDYFCYNVYIIIEYEYIEIKRRVLEYIFDM